VSGAGAFAAGGGAAGAVASVVALGAADLVGAFDAGAVPGAVAGAPVVVADEL
jgi:hypothetical protein